MRIDGAVKPMRLCYPLSAEGFFLSFVAYSSFVVAVAVGLAQDALPHESPEWSKQR